MSNHRRDRDDDHAADDRPMTEAQWEATMRESDLRSARFGELLETLRDDPDRDAKISREMGWDDDDDDEPVEVPDWMLASSDQPADGGVSDADGDADDVPPASGDAADSNPFGDDSDDEDGDVDQIPAYVTAREIGFKIHQALRPYAERLDLPADPDALVDDETEERARLIGAAGIGCHIAAAKISGGHAMGYEDDVLCGNIVNCRRGLAGVDEAIAALAELKARGVLPADVADALAADAAVVRRAVEGRIAELRKRVWWA